MKPNQIIFVLVPQQIFVVSPKSFHIVVFLFLKICILGFVCSKLFISLHFKKWVYFALRRLSVAALTQQVSNCKVFLELNLQNKENFCKSRKDSTWISAAMECSFVVTPLFLHIEPTYRVNVRQLAWIQRRLSLNSLPKHLVCLS